MHVTVAVLSVDPLLAAGVAELLSGSSDVTVVSADDLTGVAAVVLCCRRVDDVATAMVRRVRAVSSARLVVVADESVLGPGSAYLPRATVTASALLAVITGTTTGPDPEHGAGSGDRALTRREREVLALLAEGCGTGVIAARLAYSERTVRNIVQFMIERFGLHNRAHLVAHALREGLI